MSRNDNKETRTFTRSIVSYLLQVLMATVGTMMLASLAIKLLFVGWHFVDASVTKQQIYSILIKPYFPTQIVCGLLAGYLNGRRFQDRLAAWVWVIPAIRLVFALATWSSPSIFENHTRALIGHFFLDKCQLGSWTRSCIDQFLITAPFYSSLSYALGAVTARYVPEKTLVAE